MPAIGSIGDVRKLFLLSPARVAGARAGLLLNPHAPFALARTFHSSGLPLDEVFTFTSGLYFRGKIAYARHFAAPEGAIRVITSNKGLLPPDTMLDPQRMAAFGEDDIDESNPRYRRPLERDARELAKALASDGVAVLLGSIATPKYRDVLLHAFGDRLLFPAEFVGRGDMSRGALLLRHARSGEELQYISVRGAVFRGKRAKRVGEV